MAGRVAFFTAGTVGAGHLVRGIAIGRALARAGFAGRYRMFGPPLPFPAAAREDYHTVALVEDELRDPARAAASALAAALADFRPDALLVDMFWAPLRHVLPLPGCEAWLLVRACPRAWFVGDAGCRFEPAHFRRLIAIEPFRHAALGETIAPVVVANPDECRPPGALRERFGVAPERRLVAVAHAGTPGEIERLVPAGGDDAVVRCDLFSPDAPFPLAEWLGGADLVVSGAGYNAFWEAAWLGYAGRTRFTPFAREIDDQAWRVHACRGHVPATNGADVLARRLAAG